MSAPAPSKVILLDGLTSPKVMVSPDQFHDVLSPMVMVGVGVGVIEVIMLSKSDM
jgi:hypothetical protein